MAIAITIDNDTSTTNTLEDLILDESSGLQTSGTTDKGNDSNLDISDPTVVVGNTPDSNLFDGTLSGASFSASFLSFLNAATIFGYADLKLSDVQKAYAAGVEGAVSATDFVKVTVTNNETVSDLFFSDSSGADLNGDLVAGMQTLDGQSVYLWSSGDFCIATTSSTAGDGRVVAAFYLNENTTDHLSAQIQMITFEALKHTNTGSVDENLDFTSVLNVSAAGSQSFDFDALKSGGCLWCAVGSNAGAVLVSGYSLDVDAAGKIQNTSNKIAVSQGGTGTTIGLNNQLFDNVGETAVFTLVTGLDTLGSTDGGVQSDYIVDHTGPAGEGINYDGYINVTGAGIFISQSQGNTAKSFDINLFTAGGGTTPEEGFAYIGTEPSGAFQDDTPINVGTVSVYDDDGNLVGTWVAGADPDGAGPLLGSGATVSGHTSSNGTANIQVTISGNNIDVNGVLGEYTVKWTSSGATFNRFTLVDEAGQFDVGRVDLTQGVSVHQSVGSDLIVQDDGPIPSGANATFHVDEDAMTGAGGGDLSTGIIDNPDDGDGIAGEQDEVTFTQAQLGVTVNAGTDNPPAFSLVSSIASGTAVKTTSGANVFSKGDQLFWRVSGGVLQGVTDAGTADERVIFTITVNDQGTPTKADDTFTFDLKDQLDHSTGAGELANLLLNITPAFSATDADGDPVNFGTGTPIRMQVENDTPALDGDTVTKHVDEDAMTGAGGGDLSTGNIDAVPDGDGIAGEQDEVSFTQGDLQSVVAAGADEPALFSLNLSLTNGTAVKTSTGADVFSKGDQVFWRVSGGVIQGVTDAGTPDERIIFTLTVNQNGTPSDLTDDTFTFDLKDQLDHAAASGELGLLTLNVTPAFNATDFDGDALDLSNSSAIRVEAENDTPATDGDTVTKHVDEDAMTGAGGGDLSTGIVDASDDGDGIAGEQDEVSFSQSNLQSVIAAGADESVLFHLNLALADGTAVKTAAGANVFSNGDQLFWRVSGDVIQGVTDAGTVDERIVFTITKNDNALIGDPSDDTFTFDLKDQLDHANGSGELGLLTLNVTPAFGATDFDGDAVDFSNSTAIRVAVENDTPAPDGDTVTKHVDEDAMTGAGGGDLSTGIIEAPADSDGIVGEQDEVSFNQADLQGVVASGADEPVFFDLNTSLTNGTAVKTESGSNVLSKGQQVFWKVSGGVIQGVTDLGLGTERVIFTVTKNDNGTPGDPSDDTFTFDLKDQIDHANGAGELALVTLNITPAFSAKDFDGDAVSFGTAAAIRVAVENDIPTFTAQISDGLVEFATDSTGTVTHSLNGAVGADDTNATNTSQSPSVKQYTFVNGSWTEPHNVYADLDGVLSADGTKITFYSTSVTADQDSSTAVYEITLNQTANSGAGSYTFTVLQTPPISQNAFDFTDLPSGQNLFGIIASDKTDLGKGGLLVFPSNPDLAADGTMTNVSGTMNTSKGGGPVTIGNGNQAFDHTDEGAWFVYVDDPDQAAVGGLGLTQVSADDADTIDFTGTIGGIDTASVEIVQASGAGTAKRPGPSMHIATYDIDPGDVSGTGGEAVVLDPTAVGAGADQVSILAIKIIDSNGNVIEYRTNVDNGATNGGILHDSDDPGTDVSGPGGSDDPLVGIQFILDDDGGTPADPTDDIYSVIVSQLKANYTVLFITETSHDAALVENVSGSFDIGGFNTFSNQDVPSQDFDFQVQVNDYDNDLFTSTLAQFSVSIDGINF